MNKFLLLAILLLPGCLFLTTPLHGAPNSAAKANVTAPLRGSDNVVSVTFPLQASANGRYLVDANNKPFFYQADTPWMLLLNLTLPEAEEYLDDRKAKGFSALQIMLTGFMGMKNRAG